MKHKKHELDAMIDDATRSIREEQIDPSVVNSSATRVWGRVMEATGASPQISEMGDLIAMNSTDAAEQIRGCEDFQSLIPAYLNGKLSTARTLLLEDHSNECIPCRRALQAQRAGESANVAAAAAHRSDASRGFAKSWKFGTAMRWSVAAVVVVAARRLAWTALAT